MRSLWLNANCDLALEYDVSHVWRNVEVSLVCAAGVTLRPRGDQPFGRESQMLRGHWLQERVV